MKYACTILLFMGIWIYSCNQHKESYVCKPCNLACDDHIFTQAGTCPHCGMELFPVSDLSLQAEHIQTGSGFFLLESKMGAESRDIAIFYHKPQHFTPDSRIMMVIPGTGRSAESYRDAWVEESEAHDLLILSPMYPDRYYPFEAYHLGGIIENANFESQVEYVENTHFAILNEDSLSFTFNPNPEEWIFRDIDRIFDAVKVALNLTQHNYDIFGHSAGGHILHRMALFGHNTQAERIIASNASSYTVPNDSVDFPFGIKDAPIDQQLLERAFRKKLILMLGELDNENETSGVFLRSNSADRQGLHRLARGKFFFEQAEQIAQELDVVFNWELVIVPGVGHDHELMGNAAAEICMIIINNQPCIPLHACMEGHYKNDYQPCFFNPYIHCHCKPY